MLSAPRRSKFEDFSDDILMDILDCLHPPVYIYHSFYNLNRRLDRIISDARLLISLDLSSIVNPSNFAYHCQIMLPNMSRQLIFLRLSNEPKLYEQIRIFLQQVNLTSFHALRQLCLIQITFQQLKRMLTDILSLTRLTRLDIDMFDGSGVSLNELYLIANTLISKSTSIKSLHLRFNRELVISDVASSSLTRLTLDSCYSADVPQILSVCTDLQSLTVKVEKSARRSPFFNILNSEQHLKPARLTSAITSHLTYFSIDLNDLLLSDVQSFLSTMPHLIRLRIEGLSYDLDFSKGDLWATILATETSKLKQFDIVGLRIWLGNRAANSEENLHLIPQITRSFGSDETYWRKRWSVDQTHKLRANHLNLTVHAKVLSPAQIHPLLPVR